MLNFAGLNENFQFLVIEVKNQILNTIDFLLAPEPKTYDKINLRDDYIDNLKNNVENNCFTKLLSSSNHLLSKKEVDSIRAMQIIAVNLERIADFCVNIVGQVHYLTDYKFIYKFNYQDMFQEISAGLNEIIPALQENNLSKALSICRTENNLDKMYKDHFDTIMTELKAGSRNPGNYITILFIVRYLERIGDSLLNIGEAIIFSIIGEKIKINQFQALQHTLNKSGFEGSFSEVDFQLILGTRSGCRIGRLEDKEPLKTRALNSIFKEGNRTKIGNEKKNLDYWKTIFPGLVPNVFSYHEEENEDRASMLLQLLPGCTLDEALLTLEQEILENSFFVLSETLSEIWNNTKKEGQIFTDFVKQIRKRKESVEQIHPGFKQKKQLIGNWKVNSFLDLLERCSRLENQCPASFSVFIHGDFNLNNIVYNHTDQCVHFIDLHRSKDYDYLQDVSVFLISLFRIPIFDPKIRQRLDWMIEKFFNFTYQFALENKDNTFMPRLALALARSFYTSTRFELKYNFSKEMFLRAHYLLEKVAQHEGHSWQLFEFSPSILFY